MIVLCILIYIVIGVCLYVYLVANEVEGYIDDGTYGAASTLWPFTIFIMIPIYYFSKAVGKLATWVREDIKKTKHDPASQTEMEQTSRTKTNSEP